MSRAMLQPYVAGLTVPGRFPGPGEAPSRKRLRVGTAGARSAPGWRLCGRSHRDTVNGWAARGGRPGPRSHLSHRSVGRVPAYGCSTRHIRRRAHRGRAWRRPAAASDLTGPPVTDARPGPLHRRDVHQPRGPPPQARGHRPAQPGRCRRARARKRPDLLHAPVRGRRERAAGIRGAGAAAGLGTAERLPGRAVRLPDHHRYPRLLRRTMGNGVAVDVITGPAALPPTVAGPARPAIGAASGAEVTYWLDDNGRLRRLDALLRKDLPVRIEFNRDDRTAPAAVEMLGGAPVSPRPVTAAEAAVLAKLGVRARAVHGGRVSVLLPYAPAGLVRADGWLDWTGTTAYLATRDADDPGRATLVWADRMGVTTRATPAGASSPPPLAPPKGGWQLVTWAQHDRQGSSDLDILLGAALAGSPDPGKLRTRASWLRTDAVGGVPVTVYEIREAAEAATAPGQGLLRYWVDGSCTLRRAELRTGYGAYGYPSGTPRS